MLKKKKKTISAEKISSRVTRTYPNLSQFGTAKNATLDNILLNFYSEIFSTSSLIVLLTMSSLPNMMLSNTAQPENDLYIYGGYFLKSHYFISANKNSHIPAIRILPSCQELIFKKCVREREWRRKAEGSEKTVENKKI